VQLARLAGADYVVGVDPIRARRDLAFSFGADETFDPCAGDGDVGLAIRRYTAPVDWDPASVTPPAAKRVMGGYVEQRTQTQNLGVDVAIEASGSIQALHHAIRATRFGGTICVISFYGGDSAGLRLGEEFHINRLQLVSARAETLPMRDAPGWTLDRMTRTTLNWLTTGRLRADGIVTPVVSFDDSVEAYRAIDERPEESIKVGIRFHQ
jgi:threonine dehydrogenase-like Zn-dependent dehydrogenase